MIKNLAKRAKRWAILRAIFCDLKGDWETQMGSRFKIVSTGGGWSKIVRLQQPNSKQTGQGNDYRPGKFSTNSDFRHNKYSAHAYYKRYEQNSTLKRRSFNSQSSMSTLHYASTNINHQKSTITTLIPYPHASPNQRSTSNKNNSNNWEQYTNPSPILTLLQPHQLSSLPLPTNQQLNMNKNKNNHLQPSKQTNMTMNNANPRQYPNTATPTQSPHSNNIHLIQHPTRFPHPIWKSYIDSNPWTFASPPTDTQPLIPEPLPLPPDPTHHRWRGRCYNCLHIGHDQNTCTRLERTCAKCWTTGHEARACTYAPQTTQPPFDPLMPRGNLGDEKMPKDRPEKVMVFIPETNQMQRDATDMLRAVVIDARLREIHSLHILQSVLMATCATPFPFPISKINGQQYLLLLPPGIDRETFLSAHAGHLKETGYIAFPWSQSVNGKPLQMKFKVWVELRGMSPCSYTIEHLLRAAGSFGIVLEHGPMANVTSLEKMRAVVAVPSLSLVPQYAAVWVRGIIRDVQVVVHAWIEEPIPLNIQPDTTPPQAFFDQVRGATTNHPSGDSDTANPSDRLTINFDTLYNIWSSTAAGPERQKIESVISGSPLFKARQGIPTAEPLNLTPSASAKPALRDEEKQIQLEMTTPTKIGQIRMPVQRQNSINGGPIIVQSTDDTATNVPAQAGHISALQKVPETFLGPEALALTLIGSEKDQDPISPIQAGELILRTIQQGPTIEAQSDNDSPINSPTNLSCRGGPGPFHSNGTIDVGLYPMEFTGGVPLPSTVDPGSGAPPDPNPSELTNQQGLRIDSDSNVGDDEMDYEQQVNTDGEKKKNQADNTTAGDSSDSDGRPKKVAKGDTPTPRRSRRVAENPRPKNYTPKKTRQRREASGLTNNSESNSKAQLGAITQALQDEMVAAHPLSENTIREVNQYCGTHLVNQLIPTQGAADNHAIRTAMAEDFDMDNESILKSLEYDPGEDAFTDEDEELEEEEPQEEEPEEEPLDNSD